MRPSGVSLRRASACSGVYAAVPVRCDVSINAGATQLTVMPQEPTSLARCFMYAVTPARKTVERLWCGMGCFTDAEVMAMTRPHCFLSI
ncbi:hypothetical protein D3C71_1919480 [compost metagenome]